MRPRRFGKSLFCRILECYYSLNQKDDFDYLFGQTYIGQNPTPLHSSFIVLHFDFSTIDPSGTIAEIEASFNHACNLRMRSTVGRSEAWFQDTVKVNIQAKSAETLRLILNTIEQHNLPQLYVIIDEYDNFANPLITANKDDLYRQLTADNGFLKTFFKTLKEGRKTGVINNLNMRQIFVEYFNELHRIDVSTQYAEMMQSFVNRPDLFKLFAAYWQLYVSQLPEAIFGQVNENFYRTTFFELCSRYLSLWFTWNVERSYPQGKSDLEFVGKYHEKFAGLRWVIEFKYYSNREFKKRFSTRIEDFQLQAKDTQQIAGYAEGLKKEYPQAQISQFVIYCFGNQGFRVFEV